MYKCGANEIRNRSGIRIIIPENKTVYFFSGKGNDFFIPARDGDHTSVYNIPDGWDGEIGCKSIGDPETATIMFSLNCYGITFNRN